MAENLTSEQKKFLEECTIEFSDRFTESDVEYKKIYDAGIPPPPLMCPWYSRPKLQAKRYRGGSHGGSYDNNRRDNNYRSRDYGNRDNQQYRNDNRDFRRDDRRFKPY